MERRSPESAVGRRDPVALVASVPVEAPLGRASRSVVLRTPRSETPSTCKELQLSSHVHAALLAGAKTRPKSPVLWPSLASTA